MELVDGCGEMIMPCEHECFWSAPVNHEHECLWCGDIKPTPEMIIARRDPLVIEMRKLLANAKEKNGFHETIVLLERAVRAQELDVIERMQSKPSLRECAVAVC